jgi:hypothetical protein
MHHCLKQKEEGIPFYLPKPLLVISKNFRNIEETKVGLTDSAPIPNFFDDQAKYADLNARTNFQGLDGNAASGTQTVSGNEQFPTSDAKNLATAATARVYSGTGAPVSPGAVAPDGLKPEAFYTYHIVFVPDLTQKYGLKIKGGAGEIRAAMNLVNGWQFTGLGPYYMKDSSTAQNTLASGITANLAASGVADVVKAVAQFKPTTPTGAPTGGVPPQTPSPSPDVELVKALAEAMRQLNPKFLTIPDFAEISIYEPFISPEGTMEWKLIAEKSYSRDVVATDPVSAQAVRNLLKTASTSTMAFPPLATTSTLRAAQPQQAGAVQLPAVEPALAPPNEIAQLPPLQPLPPKHAASSSPIAPSSMNVSPLPQGPAASRVPPVQVPRTTLAPGTALRRSSIRTQEPDDPKADDEVVRTQSSAIPFPNQAVVASALAQTASAAQPVLSLAPTDTLRKTNNATESLTPIIDVKGAPPNVMVNLYRNKLKVSADVSTGATGDFVIADTTKGPALPGHYVYSVIQVADGSVVGRLEVDVMGSSTGGQTTAAPATNSVAAVDQQLGLAQKMLAQATALRATAIPAIATTPTGVVAVPAVPPSSGNQINLNQYFGKTKFAAPTAAAPAKRFSLFHHKKKRPTIGTINVAGLDTQAVVTGTPGAGVAAAPDQIAPPPSTSLTNPPLGAPPATPTVK